MPLSSPICLFIAIDPEHDGRESRILSHRRPQFGRYINSADLDDFVAGWGTDENEHNIETWKRGDLDLDGDTDLYDFALLRRAYPAASQIAGLLGIPEPSSFLLVALGGICAIGIGCRRSR